MNTVADEVTIVSLEVGSQRRLGGQADVRDVQGQWKPGGCEHHGPLARCAGGGRGPRRWGLTEKIVHDARGEMLECKETLNRLTESLRIFADEIARIATVFDADRPWY
ncbi:hypothetical protein DXG01_002168 [Tephrocybe rancida]|nr:hypothetical protein DXG01_002168 [Tephrocybe rancida]